jgi:hypothetical protein
VQVDRRGARGLRLDRCRCDLRWSNWEVWMVFIEAVTACYGKRQNYLALRGHISLFRRVATCWYRETDQVWWIIQFIMTMMSNHVNS